MSSSRCWSILLLLISLLVFLQYAAVLKTLRSTTSRPRAPRSKSMFTLNKLALLDDPLLTPLSKVMTEQTKEEVRIVVKGEMANNNKSSTTCPLIPPDLHGPVALPQTPYPSNLMNVEHRLKEANALPRLGGQWKPDSCKARYTLAIIVPYRQREEHLKLFLLHMHPFLQKQLASYRVFVVEQDGGGAFNRAMLLNAGALEAAKLIDGLDCFVFHDVDLLPEDDRNLYTCPQQPRHMSAAVDVFNYQLPYDDIFGGVSAMTVQHLNTVNGFSNVFWGWGGEDDDMSNRLHEHNLFISRYPSNIARYRMLHDSSHHSERINPNRFKSLYLGSKRMSEDGLNSIHYKVIKKESRALYTWLLIKLEGPGAL